MYTARKALIAGANILAAIIVLSACNHILTGMYAATMVHYGEEAIRLLYEPTAWACVGVLACVIYFGGWYRWFRGKTRILRARDFHPMQN